MKTESFLLGAVLAVSGLVTFYRCSLLTDLRDGMDRHIKHKDRFTDITTFFLRLIGLGMILGAIVVWIRG